MKNTLWKFICFAVLFTVAGSYPLLATTSSEHDWIQVGCTLQARDGQKKMFPGHMCIFQDDGTFISVSMTSMRKFSPSREVLWEIPGDFHHQINLTSDKSKIIVIGSEFTLVNKKKRRRDIIFVIDQNGKIVSQINADEILKLAGMNPVELKHHTLSSVDFEISHFNSAYEIPVNARSKEVSWLKPGNIILNTLFLGIFTLSSDLKVLHHYIHLNGLSLHHMIHDVQVTPEGELLYFNNFANKPDEDSFSAVQKLDPVNRKITFEFTARPRELFFSIGAGGVQEIGDNILFTHSRTGGYLYSKKQKDIVKTFPLNAGTSTTWIQDIKMVDAAKFLKNSHE